MKTEINPDVQAALASVASKDINHVFLVACGGSLAAMLPGKYFLDRHSSAISSDALNADEFVRRDPKRLGANSLVILCSQTGTTKETARAAEHARARGAATIGMTMDASSPLGQAVDCVVGYQSSYTTGAAIDAADTNYAVLYMLLAGLLDTREGLGLVQPLIESLDKLQAADDKAKPKFAAQLEPYVERFAQQGAIYTLASGSAFGAAYSLAICVLMEMQWYDSQAIHADEFFHGPFEVVDKDARFMVLLGLDETRPLTERARDFLMKYGSPENIIVLDAADIDVGDMDQRFSPYLVPLLMFNASWAFAYRLAELRNQPMLEGRRYMKKLTDY